MSGQCSGWVIQHGPRSLNEFAVLAVIADAADINGEHARPGMTKMIHGSRMTTRQGVEGIVKRLLRGGWIRVTEQGGGAGKATVYQVAMSTETRNEWLAGIEAGNPQHRIAGNHENPQRDEPKPATTTPQNPQRGENSTSYTTDSTTTTTGPASPSDDAVEEGIRIAARRKTARARAAGKIRNEDDAGYTTGIISAIRREHSTGELENARMRGLSAEEVADILDPPARRRRLDPLVESSTASSIRGLELAGEHDEADALRRQLEAAS